MNKIRLAFLLYTLFAPLSFLRAESLEKLLVNKGVIAQEEAAKISQPAKIYYNKKTNIEFPDTGAGVGVLTLLQPRYQFTDQDEAAGKENASSFQLRRARLYVMGYALNKEFNYTLMTDFVGTTSSDGSAAPDLQDAFIDYYPIPSLDVRMGQFLVPFVRESLQAYTQQFPDFSVATTNFALFRQQGAGTWWSTDDKTFTVGASMYNGNSTGEGRNRPGVDTLHSAVGNLRWSPLAAINPFEEGDIGNTQEPAISVGAAYLYNDSNTAFEDDLLTNRVNGYNADFNFKYLGFSIHSEIMGWNRSGEVGSSSPIGGYFQAGYFLLPSEFELASRYSVVDCDNGGGTNCSAAVERLQEASVSGNYFFTKSHALKAQLAWTWRRDELKDTDQDIDSSRIVLQVGATL